MTIHHHQPSKGEGPAPNAGGVAVVGVDFSAVSVFIRRVGEVDRSAQNHLFSRG